MKFGSVCSGIEAASVAWNPLGWKAQWLSEIEPFPCSLLAHHYPDTPNLGDMTKFNEWPTDDKHAIDLLCGGTPCQSFSVAGLRKGLDDPRGNLMLTFGAIAAKYRPQWLVWENVPGILSSNGGADFGAFLGMLGQLGYGFAYRVLDAQYFGVAQRRRRVFVVGCFGDWRSAAAVLFERHSLQGHPAPSREAGKEITSTLASRARSGSGYGPDTECPVIAIPQVSPTLTSGPSSPASHGKKSGTDREVLIPVPHATCIAFPERMSGTQCASTENLAPSMGALNPTAVAVSLRGREGGAIAELGDEVGNCLRASGGGGDKAHVLASMAVRRLTPRECEALQGFPPGYTNIPHRGKPAADGPRYKAIGNSWAVPNVRWIGRRIDAVAEILKRERAAA